MRAKGKHTLWLCVMQGLEECTLDPWTQNTQLCVILHVGYVCFWCCPTTLIKLETEGCYEWQNICLYKMFPFLQHAHRVGLIQRPPKLFISTRCELSLLKCKISRKVSKIWNQMTKMLRMPLLMFLLNMRVKIWFNSCSHAGFVNR